MACCFARKSLKCDEVSPIGTQPRKMSGKGIVTNTNAVTTRAEGNARDTTPTTQEDTKATSQNDAPGGSVSIPLRIMACTLFSRKKTNKQTTNLVQNKRMSEKTNK